MRGETIRRLVLSATLLGLCTWAHAAPPEVPEVLEWCGMRLHLSPGARAAIQTQVNKLTANATVQRAMAERADTYFPFAADALAHIGAPDDLKYLMIQESGVRPDVVSTSMAVGFWQLKDYTATEMGVTVSSAVDERKHITGATVAAARYFIRANSLYQNWLYAVIAYYEGPTGALPHTDPSLYSTREMTVPPNLHWYAVKALAHKVAYAGLVGRAPAQRLAARDTEGETSVWVLAKRAGLSAEALRSWNRWIGASPLPTSRRFSYFTPSADTAHRPDPTLALYARPLPQAFVTRTDTVKPPPADRTQVPQPRAPLPSPPTVALLPLSSEPEYGQSFTYVAAGEDLRAVAERTQQNHKRLAKVNGLSPTAVLTRGTLILLREPKRIGYHVVTPGNTLSGIARQYGVKPDELARRNAIAPDAALLIGTKLWLRADAPAERPRYDLSPWFGPSGPVPTGSDSTRVQPGETLYGIARRYGLTAETLRRLNGLSSDTLSVGQVLRLR